MKAIGLEEMDKIVADVVPGFRVDDRSVMASMMTHARTSRLMPSRL